MSFETSSRQENSVRNSGEIRPLQYARGIAALFVCLFHYEGAMNQLQASEHAELVSTIFGTLFRAGHSGVEFFFILSGFIIFHAHRRDVGRPGRLGDFYLKRAIRILPMFWLIVIPFGITVLMISTRGILTPGGFLLDVLLIPRSGTLTLPAAWTLQHELVFYLLFGLLIFNKHLGVAMIGLWQGTCVIVLAFDLLPQDYLLPATIFLGYYNFGFLFGIAIAVLREHAHFEVYRRGILLLGGVGLVGLLVCFIGEARVGDKFFISPAAASLTYFALYSLVILGLLSVENKPRPILDASLGALGGASYILYIIHEPLYSVLNKLFLLSVPRSAASTVLFFALSMLVAVSVSVLLYYSVERPTLRHLRRHLLPPSPAVAAVTAA